MSKLLLEDVTPVRRYSVLLLELDEWIAVGKGDDDEADRIREAMDAPWYRMTESQQALMGWLTVDLDRLADETPPPADSEGKDLWKIELRQAWRDLNHGEEERILSLLRRGFEFAPATTLFFMQARAWQVAGFPEVATRFLQKLEQRDREMAIGLLEILQEEPPVLLESNVG